MAESAAATAFTNWLEKQCEFLRHLEKTAVDEASANGNSVRYRELMLQKALFLEALGEGAAPYLEGLPPDIAGQAEERFARFQKSARQAMACNSPWYMSALLYPDDHKPGQPNDLEAFHQHVCSLCGR